MNYTFTARLLEHGRRMASALRAFMARATGAEIGENCVIGPGCDLALGVPWPRRGRLHVGNGCELGHSVILHPYGGNIRVERNVFIGPGSAVYGHGGVTIGEGSLIAMHCRILSSNHTLAPFGTPIRSQPDVLLPTRIGRDVWLGAGVTVLGGVTIGDGCVVGAGAVVTKNLPAGAIAHGIPANVQSHRDGAPRTGAT
jgi:acetyltransferase-like isoleucine patch superfamily enzyme